MSSGLAPVVTEEFHWLNPSLISWTCAVPPPQLNLLLLVSRQFIARLLDLFPCIAAGYTFCILCMYRWNPHMKHLLWTDTAECLIQREGVCTTVYCGIRAQEKLPLKAGESLRRNTKVNIFLTSFILVFSTQMLVNCIVPHTGCPSPLLFVISVPLAKWGSQRDSVIDEGRSLNGSF